MASGVFCQVIPMNQFATPYQWTNGVKGVTWTCLKWCQTKTSSKSFTEHRQSRFIWPPYNPSLKLCNYLQLLFIRLGGPLCLWAFNSTACRQQLCLSWPGSGLQWTEWTMVILKRTFSLLFIYVYFISIFISK